MRAWFNILDHGDDPGRYTLIDANGRVVTASSNGVVVFERKCRDPYALVGGLSREIGIRVVKPSQQDEIAEKVFGIKPDKPIKTKRPTPTMLPDDVRGKLLAYARGKWPTGDNYHARISGNGNYVVGFTNDYPLQHGPGEEEILTPEQYLKL